MKWVLFTGSWRYTNEDVEKDVRESVREVLGRGDGVITGGATGVDFFTMDEVFKIEPARLIVIIPADLESYIEDCATNWCLEPITADSVEKLAVLLKEIKSANPDSLIEMPYTKITQEHYNLRNEEEVKKADVLRAFQVNESTGTQHTIDKAKEAGLTIEVHKKYKISDEND